MNNYREDSVNLDRVLFILTSKKHNNDNLSSIGKLSNILTFYIMKNQGFALKGNIYMNTFSCFKFSKVKPRSIMVEMF